MEPGIGDEENLSFVLSITSENVAPDGTGDFYTSVKSRWGGECYFLVTSVGYSKVRFAHQCKAKISQGWSGKRITYQSRFSHLVEHTLLEERIPNSGMRQNQVSPLNP